MRSKLAAVTMFGMTLGLIAGAQQSAKQETLKQVTWRFDDTGMLGGHVTKILGHPRVIETPTGKAVAFNGVDDALFVNVHPLAGAGTGNWGVIFRPDANGKAGQRTFHFQ